MQVATSRPAIHPAALRGQGTGMLVAALFGALWANAALTAEPMLRVWPSQVAIIAITITLLIAGIVTIMRGGRLAQSVGAPASPRRRVWHKFLLVVLAEIAVLNLVAWGLGRHDLMNYLMPAIAIIVGLHFFPLARIFRSHYMHITATLMTLAGVGAVFAMISGASPALANSFTDVVCAVVLWGTVIVAWTMLHNTSVATQTDAMAIGFDHQ